MNKLFAIALAAIAASAPAANAGTPIAADELPQAAQTFIAQHFAGDVVSKAEADREWRGVDYEVDLASGAEIDFDDKGEWREVKAARGKAVPAAIVPAAIASYVAANYGEHYIAEIARKRGGYEVELSNGVELKLTAEGQPMPARKGGKGGNRR